VQDETKSFSEVCEPYQLSPFCTESVGLRVFLQEENRNRMYLISTTSENLNFV